MKIPKLSDKVSKKSKNPGPDERRLQALIACSTDALLVVDEQGSITYASPSAVRIFGYDDDEEIISLQLSQVLHHADQVLIAEKFAESIANPGIPVQLKMMELFHEKKGSIMLSVTLNNKLHDPDVRGIIISSHDITEHTKAGLEQHGSDMFNKGVLASLSASIAVIEHTGVIVAVNQAWKNFAAENGAQNPEKVLEGANYLEECKRASQAGDVIGQQVLDGIREVLNKEKNVFELEYPCHSPQKQQWFILTVSGFGGDSSKVVLSHQDITQQKLAEQTKSRSELNLKDAQMVAKVGSWETNYDTLEVTWSEETYRIFELLPGDIQLSHKVFLQHVHPDDREKVNTALISSSDQNIYYSIDHRIITPSGEKIVKETWHVYKNDKNMVVRALGTCQDITERTKFEERTKLNAELLNTIGQSVIATSMDGTITFWNKAGEEIYGWTSEEALGQIITTLIPSHHSRQQNLEIMERLRKGQSWHGDVEVRRKDGTYFPAFVTDSPIFDKENNLTGIISVSTDITEKKKLEDLLAKTNAMARIGNYEADFIHNKLYWSSVTKQIHEVAPDYVPTVAQGIDFYIGHNQQLITQAIEDGIVNNTPFDMELQIRTAKGNDRWVRVTGDVDFENGKAAKLYGSFQDIDAAKKAEIEILKVYEEKNSILESISDAFFAVDKNWKVTYWNHEAENLLTVSRGKILGNYLWEVISESHNPTSYRHYQSAMKYNKTVHFEDHYFKLQKWFAISVYPSVNGLTVFFNDITLRKETEVVLLELNETLIKNAKQLAISNTELEQFAYVASHDLQEPLRMVSSFLSLLKKKYRNILDDKGMEYIDFAVSGARRMRQIILDILEFSRVGKMEDKKEEVDLNEIVNTILMLQKNLIKEKNALIQADQLPVVRTFKAPIMQVFQNLISNALKYQREGLNPEIAIKVTDDIYSWLFTISDNGIGIEPAYFEKIFVIFQRLHNKEKYSGTGLGLAISKKIIENMGGTIWLQSETGKGSNFYFTIPKDAI